MFKIEYRRVFFVLFVIHIVRTWCKTLEEMLQIAQILYVYKQQPLVYLFTHTNWPSFCFAYTRWFESRSTPYFSICQSLWVFSALSVSFYVRLNTTRSLSLTYTVYFALLDISVASLERSFNNTVYTIRYAFKVQRTFAQFKKNIFWIIFF